jgi:hypothetical protein
MGNHNNILVLPVGASVTRALPVLSAAHASRRVVGYRQSQAIGPEHGLRQVHNGLNAPPLTVGTSDNYCDVKFDGPLDLLHQNEFDRAMSKREVKHC